MKRQSKAEQEDERQLHKTPINEFTCCDKVRNFKDHKEHLLNDHKLNIDQLQGKKSMLMHMDGDYWFAYNWQWTLESGLIFTQYTKQVRAKDDYMRF